jgi:hypothetical protein
MKKYIYLMLAVTFVSVLSACSSYNYYTAAANKTNLSGYRTFAWAPMKRDSGKQWRPLTEIGNGKLQESAKTALLQKGLTINEQNPDLLVGYATVTGRGTKINYYYSTNVRRLLRRLWLRLVPPVRLWLLWLWFPQLRRCLPAPGCHIKKAP